MREKNGMIGNENEKQNFWESDVVEKWTETVDGGVKERKRSGRYGTKTRYEDNKKTIFFWARGCEFISHTMVAIERSNFSVQFFQILINFFCKFLIMER